MTKPPDDPDELLLGRWRGGDRRAGKALTLRYHDDIVRFFKGRVSTLDAVEDLTQKTFLAVLEQADRFRGEASFRTYIYKIARYQLYHHYRGRGPAPELFDPSVVSLAALDPTPTQRIHERQRRVLLIRALRELPLDDQLLLELRFRRGLSWREVAEVLELKENTAKTRARRSCAKLSEHMTRLAESPDELEASLSQLSEWAARLGRTDESDT